MFALSKIDFISIFTEIQGFFNAAARLFLVGLDNLNEKNRLATVFPS